MSNNPQSQTNRPECGWLCFHCGEHLQTRGAARDHFGETPDKVPGCIIKAGDERGLLQALRKAEAEVDRLRTDIENETSSTAHYYSLLQSDLRSHKPFRKCRTVQDAFMVYDSMEGEAIAAKEQVALLQGQIATAKADALRYVIDESAQCLGRDTEDGEAILIADLEEEMQKFLEEAQQAAAEVSDD